MRRFGLALAVCLLVPALALVPSIADAGDEAEIQQAYMKVKLSRLGNVFAHPGYLVAIDEEGIFVITIDGKVHEVSVSIIEANDNYLSLEVIYSIEGRQQMADGVRAKPGEDVVLTHGKTKLTVNVDPQGSKDTSRDDDDDIDKPKHDDDDPLGGM